MSKRMTSGILKSKIVTTWVPLALTEKIGDSLNCINLNPSAQFYTVLIRRVGRTKLPHGGIQSMSETTELPSFKSRYIEYDYALMYLLVAMWTPTTNA